MDNVRAVGLFVAIGAASGCLGVALGAFGAHGLKGLLLPERIAVYQTAVQYQLWHSLALLAIAGFLQHRPESRHLYWSGWCMTGGLVLFCGSLYALSLSGARWLGLITPFGGGAFLAGWALLAWHGFAQARRGARAS